MAWLFCFVSLAASLLWLFDVVSKAPGFLGFRYPIKPINQVFSPPSPNKEQVFGPFKYPRHQFFLQIKSLDTTAQRPQVLGHSCDVPPAPGEGTGDETDVAG